MQVQKSRTRTRPYWGNTNLEEHVGGGGPPTASSYGPHIISHIRIQLHSKLHFGKRKLIVFLIFVVDLQNS